MNANKPPSSLGRFGVVECALGMVVVAFAIGNLVFFMRNGYLPQPFFYDANDSLMDFYHTAYWAHTDGPYSIWNSIYPPLSFALLKFATPAFCYLNDGFTGRDCDPSAWWAMSAATLLLGLSVATNLRGTAWPVIAARVAAVCVGLPTLFAFERGNLLLLAAPALVYGLTRPTADWRASFALAFAINLKPYLVLLVLTTLVNHGGKAAVRLLAASAAVYLVSIIAVGDGLPWQILSNVQGFTGDGAVSLYEKFYFSSSFSPFIRILESDLPLDMYLDSSTLAQALLSMRSVIAGCALLTVASLAAALSLPMNQRPRLLVTCIVLTFAFVLVESFGGYAITFVIAVLFSLRTLSPGTAACLVLCYLLSIPYDHLMVVVRESEGSIWLSGLEVETRYGIGLGQGIRPAMIALVNILLCSSVLAQAARHWHPLAPRALRTHHA